MLGQVASPNWSVGRPTFGAPSPPLASWWCPHLSCKCCPKLSLVAHLLASMWAQGSMCYVWIVEGKHTWIQGLGLTPWSMPWIMPWRGAPGGPKPWSTDLGYGAHIFWEVERRHTHLPWGGSKNTTYERLESVIKGNSKFYLKILQNSRIIVDQRAGSIVLDLTVCLWTA